MQSALRSSARCSRWSAPKHQAAWAVSQPCALQLSTSHHQSVLCAFAPAPHAFSSNAAQHRSAGQCSTSCRAAAAEAPSASDLASPSSLDKDAYEVVDYAIKFAFTSETYEVHSWMLVLGILKNESCVAAQILKELGIDDLYGAWNETLWALNACNGLDARAFTPTVQFGVRAAKVLEAAIVFAGHQEREKVHTEDILLALAGANVWSGLFPDVDLRFETVRAAVARWSGGEYKLPGAAAEEPASKEEMFL